MTRGVEAFGLELMIEFITAVGFYTMVAMVLNSFDAPVPGNLTPLPRLSSLSQWLRTSFADTNRNGTRCRKPFAAWLPAMTRPMSRR